MLSCFRKNGPWSFSSQSFVLIVHDGFCLVQSSLSPSKSSSFFRKAMRSNIERVCVCRLLWIWLFLVYSCLTYLLPCHDLNMYSTFTKLIQYIIWRIFFRIGHINTFPLIVRISIIFNGRIPMFTKITV